jgi:plasmid stability protein
MAKQLTIRGVPDEVASRLDRLSQSRGCSVNATVVEILASAVDFKERRERLARYATWTEDDLAEFMSGLSAQRVIDDQLWR